jgi:hypothetical protein
MSGLIQRLKSIGVHRASQWMSRHRRSITTLAIAGLTGFAVTAFGIAPLAPDAAMLPQRWLSETVQPFGVTEQLDALAQHELVIWRSEVTRGSETADSLLRRLGVLDPQALHFLRTDLHARQLTQGRGKLMRAKVDAQGQLLELVARYPAEQGEQLKTTSLA